VFFRVPSELTKKIVVVRFPLFDPFESHAATTSTTSNLVYFPYFEKLQEAYEVILLSVCPPPPLFFAFYALLVISRERSRLILRRLSY
jgi:hypothetical protein